MKKITKKRVITETMYETIDGAVFVSKSEAKNHERELEFNSFLPDKNEMLKGFNNENKKHFVHEFLHSFYRTPVLYKEEFFNKKVELSFFTETLNVFSKDFYKSKTVYKENMTFEKVIAFFLNKMKIPVSDLCQWDLLGLSYKRDSIEAFNLIIKNGLNVDIEEWVNKMSEIINDGWWGNTRESEIKRDFISHLAIEKKSKWLKVILDFDPEIKLFKYRSYISDFKFPNEKMSENIQKKRIDVSLEELIHKVKFTFDMDTKVYHLNVGYEPIVEILLNAKDKFKKINTNIYKSEELFLVEETVKKMIVFFNDNPKLKSFVNIDVSELGIIVKESLPKFDYKNNHNRTAMEKHVIFFIEDISSKYNGQYTNQVLIYSNECYLGTNHVFKHDKIEIKFLHLDDYKNNPQKLAEDIFAELVR